MFFKHQDFKLACLAKLDELNLDSNAEFKEYGKLLNDKLDRKIEIYDREICYRNFNLFDQVKKTALNEYRNYMEEKVKNLLIELFVELFLNFYLKF